MSKIESLINNGDFDYLQPYFYTNPYALRCELGIGDTDEEFLQQAKCRIEMIYKILFPKGADAFFFNYWKYDYSNTGDADEDNDGESIDCIVECEMKSLSFLLECQSKFRHTAVKNLKTYAEPDDEDFGDIQRNRIICYSNRDRENDLQIISRQIADENSCEISLVSFENECIMSVYDDRGCDIVFATPQKMKEFYPLLKPYFLDYDREEMERRFNTIVG